MVHAARRRGKGRPRILYWFRTPPNIRVGRAPIDEDAIRAIEQNNPGLAFDWNKILEAQSTVSEPRRVERSPRRQGRPPVAEPRRRAAPGDAGQASSTPVPIPIDEIGEDPDIASEVRASDVDESGDVPADIGALDESGEDGQPETIRPQSGGPVEGLVGAEGLARLRTRYAELMARINERPREAEEAERLKAQASELDPDSWVTDGDARAALETYESRLEILRQTLGPRRRRSRRGGARRNRNRRGGGQPPEAAAGHQPLDSQAFDHETAATTGSAGEPADSSAAADSDDDSAL